MAAPPGTSQLLSKDLTILIMQFLQEDKWQETLHKLQQESGYYFDMKYFEEMLLGGHWIEVEKYLSGFTKLDDNRYSMKIFFEIRKQKYLEALDRHDRAAAVDILVKDLKVFESLNEELFKEITQLLTLNNFRDNAQLSAYVDVETARLMMTEELKKLVLANPCFRDKLQFPKLKNSRLRTLINQSLNWQHSLCHNPKQNPDIRTLFVDHTCRHPDDPFAHVAANGQAPQMGVVQRADGFIPIGVNGSFLAPIAHPPSQPPLSTWMSNPPSVNQLAASAGGIGLGIPANPASSSAGPANPEDLFRMRFPAASGRVIMPGINSGHVLSPALNARDDFPKAVARILNQGSVPTSMDFHPLQQTLLLVGTNVGDISIWEVSSREKLVSRSFHPWDMAASSMALKATLVKDPSVSVKRVLWSPDGSLFGVAYSKHMLQLYGYFGGHDIRQHIEIDAHVGSVNDLAFCTPIRQLCVITCGDDKAIKVWDAATGSKLYTFEGHEAPVHSVCPHSKENVHFVFSTSVDGQIKAWLYEVMGPRVNYDAPNLSCTRMVYSADGSRLFSCGTSKDGESHVVEWNENEGTIKRNYQGFKNLSLGVVQFDTTRNKYLAVGDDYVLKVWDMDNVNLLSTIEAEGGLPATPRIRFNKDGSLLAVSATDNKIKVLATTDGVRLMSNYNHSLFASRNAAEKNGSTRSMDDIKKPRLSEELNRRKIWKLTEISDTARIRSLRISMTTIKTDKIARLVYTNSGNAILALASNGTHLLWRWPRGDQSTSGKATTKVSPRLVEQASGILMVNDLTGAKPDNAIHCLALSKNDSYVVSASGGKISLFNLMTFKNMSSFMSPPPVVTCLALHPDDNNIVAVGCDDSTIHIYNVRTNEARITLKGHTKGVTSLAFSQLLKTLVSSGADAQIVVWSSDKWEKQKNSFLDIPAWTTPTGLVGSHLQYQKDQNHFLIVHRIQLAVYETLRLECQKKWVVGESSAPLSCATFSCDNQLVYATFLDGTVCVFAASNLHMQCQINPYAYLPPNVSSGTYPSVVAANPQEPNQFAVGLTDGTVVMLEPLESGDSWGVPPPADNGYFHASISANGSSLEQLHS
ncbi:protein TPR3-like [Argentina anserina]|uniref:protein TPR3-like n=1 Tax=Argentina anserina TaxID=57926 RepID=UPI0021763CD4|nr:protein TPR3-like [Potentilla anserina]